MLTQLATVRARVGLTELEVQWDAMLTSAIKAVSARFDKQCNRTFARTVGATMDFDVRDKELLVPCYPVESVTKWETKVTELEGWTEVTEVDFLLRGGGVVSLITPMAVAGARIARVTYTGGYVLPGNVPGAGQTALPVDIEHAAIEQVCYWFQNREKLGLIRHWPSDGTYLVFAQQPLLASVSQILRKHERWCV